MSEESGGFNERGHGCLNNRGFTALILILVPICGQFDKRINHEFNSRFKN